MDALLIWLVVLGATSGGVPALRVRHTRLCLPVATLVIVSVTLAMSAWGNLDPGVLDALRRYRDRLTDGEWWRLVTSLVVQDGGWSSTVFNIAILLIIGGFVELLFGWRVLLGVYLAAGLISEVVAYTLIRDQGFAGNSVAVMGLAGLLVVAYLRSRHPQLRLAGAIGLVGGAGLILTGKLHGAGFAVGTAAGIVIAIRATR